MVHTGKGTAVGSCGLDRAALVLQVRQRGRNGGEVSGHRRAQRPTEAGQHAHREHQRGLPIAAVITGKAANALPMITVNSAIPTRWSATAANGEPSGSGPLAGQGRSQIARSISETRAFSGFSAVRPVGSATLGV